MVDRSDDASCLLGLEGLAVERVVLTVLGVKIVQLVTDDQRSRPKLRVGQFVRALVVASEGADLVATVTP